jgi:ATP-dependent helicase/nuclease subunit B
MLPALARAILDGRLPQANGTRPSLLALPAITILLPTRRSARALQDAFLAAAGTRSLLLPRIRPIAEGDEPASLIAGLASIDMHAGDHGDIPSAISSIERRLVMTELVLRWSEAMRRGGDPHAPFAAAGASTPAQASALARELGALMDAVETENVRLDRLADLVPENFSEHWQKTLQFLDIVLTMWPAHLAERGLLSPADRRNRIILAEARRFDTMPPAGPVIVAGVTGSIPATVELMKSVLRLPKGAIVLPGLDPHLDDESWRSIADHSAEHPQFGLATLINRLGLARENIRELEPSPPSSKARARLISEALRPAASTSHWRGFIETADRAVIRAGLDGVARIVAPTEQDEAEAIALILREVAEVPGRTAALVSPDRLLARRVAIRLEGFGIRVDDSAGRPFAKTVPGAFLDLVLEAVRTDFAPAAVMALLKHPLTRLGLKPFDVRRAARSLEIAVFRTTYLGRGLAGLEAGLAKAEQERLGRSQPTRAARRLWDEDLAIAHDLATRLSAAVAPLAGLFSSRTRTSLRALTEAHVTAAEAIAERPEDGQPSALWDGEAGLAATTFFANLLDTTLPTLDIAAADYPDLYRGLIVGENVRPKVPVHPRLSIWGPFEARLQQPDVVVLGGLNEGTWPEAADPGPWLNRPMRRALGLPQPEEKIGYAAHDFTQLLGAREVILTRAAKVDGVPTVASRWLLRLDALLAGLGLADALTPRRPWLSWARARDIAPRRSSIMAPEPRPPVALRPRRLSVSDVETWIANPYAIFARHILDLEPLPMLGGEPDAALRGALLHASLGRFAERFPDALPPDPEAELMQIARAVLAEVAAHPRIRAFWVPRLHRFARWFGETEAGRRTGVATTRAELGGEHILAAPAGPFTLRARADRIDIRADGLVITDYKTARGIDEMARRAVRGEAPQLPLEAAIARAGGFAHVDERRVVGLRYISASGGEPAGEEAMVDAGDIGQLASDVEAALGRLVAMYDDPSTPYRAVRRARFRYDFDVYAHLARVAEWSGRDDSEEDAA